MEKHSQRYSIRKYSFGAASVLLGTAAFALSATTALADENSTVPAADNAGSSAEVAANQAGPQTKVINQTTVGDTTTTTKEVTSPELETAKENAQKANVPAEETEAKVQPSVEAADADNKAQAEAINKSVTDYQTQQAAYEKAKAEYDSKSAEKAAADKLNAQAKGAYDAAMIQYNQDKAAYDAALAQYNIDKATYAQQKIQYEVSLAEKEAADKANAAAKLKYDQEMQAYNAAKADYDSALAQYNADKKKYDAAKATYDSKLAEKAAADKANAAAKLKYDQEKAVYDQAKAKYDQDLAKYQQDKAKYDSAKATYDSKLAEKAAADKANAAAKLKYDQEKAVYDQAKAKYDQDLAKYQQDKAKYDSAKSTYDSKLAEKAAAEKINAENEAKYNQAKEAYNQARAQYEHQLAEYQTKYEHWKNSKDAYDKFLADHNLTETQAAQELIFEREKDAVHTIEGINTYLTPEAQKRIGTSAVNQYRSNEIKEGDVVTNSPYGNKDNEWLQVKEGDKFTVTYDGLSQSKMIIEGVPQDINKVIYHYSIDELPSFNKAGIAKVSNDPTVTLTVGASTDDPNKAVKVTVDIEFYDKNGQKYDLTKRKAIVALNSLNHWTGAAYVSGEDMPRALTVEARDTEGNTVRGTWNPYADGSHPDIKNGEVQTKSGYADFGGKTVIISADNPLKIVTQSYTVAPNSLETLTGEAITEESSVKASGSANAHSIGSQNYSYEDEGVQKDDVIGSYYVDAETGLITFVPKKKFQNVEHQEFVNIGDNQYIAIPNSSVTYDPNTHEVTSQADNQYIEHGAVFNGESTPTLPGWDNEDSPYLYYGGAGMRMTNGHLVFTAKGANAVGAPTIYWFAINSTVGYPKNPGEEPPKPKAPTPPTPPKKVIVEVPGEPHEPTPPTSPVAPEPPKMTIIEVPGEPHEPTAPTPPVAPEPPKMITIEVPGEPHKPTPPTAPVPPTKPKTITVVVPKKPNEPKAPTLPNPPRPPKTISVEVPNEPTPPTKPSVKWHKNIIVESVKTPKPGVPTPPTVPNTPPKSVQPVKSENPTPAQPQPAAEKTLPQTGDSNSYGVTVFGAGIIAFSIITMLGAMKRKEN
ncbi:GbpC/Spa domain-containing protein [Streptococcus tangpeifui]|uniref:GbpC/Spa domain-containing protein n=1 Tax=Streptococcus tangpeifui TaxID=2709400 RepID=UPI0013ECE5A1|nr:MULTISPECIES: GbpC/Spa domain-containing protein [unclassified Streptococcus]